MLDRILEDPRIAIEGISATSAGAMNAAVLAYGLTIGGREGARQALTNFWRRVAHAASFSPLQPTMFDRLAHNHGLENSPAHLVFDILSRVLSPYQWNPLNYNPLRGVLEQAVDFDALRKGSAVKLFLSATNVRTGKVKVFTEQEMTADCVLASACLPFLYQAVNVDGEYYWDGGYMGNPALFPLIYGCESRDIVVVHINPMERPDVPHSARDIMNRINEISFNSSLMREMRAVAVRHQAARRQEARRHRGQAHAGPCHLGRRRDAEPRRGEQAQRRVGIPHPPARDRTRARRSLDRGAFRRAQRRVHDRHPRHLSLSRRRDMAQISQALEHDVYASGTLLRTAVIGLTAFLTLVDLFATQAILPSLTRSTMASRRPRWAFAVNASTFGMAVAGLGVALFSRRIDRRSGILVSLALLSIPTALLASAPDLTAFTLLRVAQGLCMAAAFTLTLAYLGEHCGAADAGTAFAAYITGNVASNFIGRLVSASIADHFGLASNFYFFAALNVAGALLVYFTIHRAPPMAAAGAGKSSTLAAWGEHLRNRPLRAAFGIGFCILFAFIGTFTYVNFVLVREPLSLGSHGARLRLLRVPARDGHHADGRTRGGTHSGRARPCGARSRSPALGLPLAACAESCAGTRRNGAGRGRDLLRTGDRDRLRRSGRDRGPRRRERHLSRVLFLRRDGRDRAARTVVRPHRLGRLRRGNRS